MTPVVQLLVGLVALLVGAELVVRSATAVAGRLGVPPMVIGLTVVSVGTSLPELAIGIDAARTGNAGIAVGGIVGTNMVNLLLILGLSAAITPVLLDRMTLRRDLPAAVLSALLLLLLVLDGELGLVDGLLLCVAGVGYTLLVVRTSRSGDAESADSEDSEKEVEEEAAASAPPRLLPAIVLLLAGMVAIVVGAQLLVEGASAVAADLGVSDAVIGLTVVAIGTSAPELVTTVVSTLRGNRDVAIGNLLGSSTYNIVLVLGLTVLAAPKALPISRELVGTDLALMVVVALLAIPVFLSGGRISRREGLAAMAAYAVYLGWLLTTRT